MTSQNNDFSPESVLASVATELRYNKDDLVVTWDEHESPLVLCLVAGRSNKMELVVYRNEAAAIGDCQKVIHQQLFSGRFLTQTFEEGIERSVLEAVAKVCNLADLTPYLTVAVREGWVMPNDEANDLSEHLQTERLQANEKTIPEMKANQAILLAKWLKKPVDAVWRLQGGDVASTVAVLIEQCSFDLDKLIGAIMTGMGGWRSFEICPIVATTPEGYIIVSANEQASTYLEELFAVTKSDPPFEAC
jgi:hypothetical protein